MNISVAKFYYELGNQLLTVIENSTDVLGADKVEKKDVKDIIKEAMGVMLEGNTQEVTPGKEKK